MFKLMHEYFKARNEFLRSMEQSRLDGIHCLLIETYLETLKRKHDKEFLSGMKSE